MVCGRRACERAAGAPTGLAVQEAALPGVRLHRAREDAVVLRPGRLLRQRGHERDHEGQGHGLPRRLPHQQPVRRLHPAPRLGNAVPQSLRQRIRPDRRGREPAGLRRQVDGSRAGHWQPLRALLPLRCAPGGRPPPRRLEHVVPRGRARPRGGALSGARRGRCNILSGLKGRGSMLTGVRKSARSCRILQGQGRIDPGLGAGSCRILQDLAGSCKA
ncbi:unnamed protein product [Prorocentrum cordatum]|uniref:Uncharacterized protein n=1 Tax=Prorocentrum cordatum TaxID=2364126 RepID=A0ABN9Q195_9DINO|nr:unnamed protein product [Polarella glacialis]